MNSRSKPTPSSFDPDLPRPDHVGIILDGNGRWARARGLPRTKGHEAGAATVRRTIQDLLERRIPFVTLYAFSAQSWSRPKEEVDTLLRMVQEFAEEMREPYAAAGISVVAVGDLDELPTPTRRAVERMVEDTSSGERMKLAL